LDWTGTGVINSGFRNNPDDYPLIGVILQQTRLMIGCGWNYDIRIRLRELRTFTAAAILGS
jgi:hypothetical protein